MPEPDRKNLGAELACPIETKREFVCLGKAFKTREAAEEYRAAIMREYDLNLRKKRLPVFFLTVADFDVTERRVPLPVEVFYDDYASMEDPIVDADGNGLPNTVFGDLTDERDLLAAQDFVRRHMPGMYGYFFGRV